MHDKVNKHETQTSVLVVLVVLVCFAQASCDLGFVLLMCVKV